MPTRQPHGGLSHEHPQFSSIEGSSTGARSRHRPGERRELPADTILNRVDIVRALLAATAALDAVRERAMRRAQLPESVGKKWSEEEEQQLAESSRSAK